MDNIEKLISKLKKELESLTDLNSLNNIKAEYLGKKGLITEFSKKISTLSIEEKKNMEKN